MCWSLGLIVLSVHIWTKFDRTYICASGIHDGRFAPDLLDLRNVRIAFNGFIAALRWKMYTGI